SEQMSIVCAEDNFRAIGQSRVRDFYLGSTRLKFLQTRHVLSVQHPWIRIVALLESFCLLPQMLLNGADLLFGRGVPDDHALDATVLSHAENMNGLRHVERHDRVSRTVNVLLCRLRRRFTCPPDHACRRQKRDPACHVVIHLFLRALVERITQRGIIELPRMMRIPLSRLRLAAWR